MLICTLTVVLYPSASSISHFMLSRAVLSCGRFRRELTSSQAGYLKV
ncbi:MAG: hypothetical protein LBL33_02280 [Tannerella sp.]|nr:hypothetical protein [Tannerella sp.]